jgi:hypothetical protein
MVYRTRFLVCARRLTQPLTFVDALGREHTGQVGDYLVESSDGTLRITTREIFEDVYVPMRRNRIQRSETEPNRGGSPYRDAPRRAMTV